MPGIGATLGRRTYRLTVALFPAREELPMLLNARGLLGCGVEVGVQAGLFSEVLLRDWKGMHLISVDPWVAAEPEDYVDISNVEQGEHDRLYSETCQRLQPFGERSTVWRTTSLEAAQGIPNHSLDFVYLDARHDYESVKEDVATWYPKIRPRGVMAGHDYFDGERQEGVYGVKSAVDEFFAGLSVPVSSTYMDAPWDSWIVEKPAPGDQVGRLAWKSGSAIRLGLAQLRHLRLRYDELRT